MQTVREFGDFYKDALALLGEQGHSELINFIAANPESGDIIPGTGGFRKLRFRRPGMGKRGGVRVVYYYYNKETPISLLLIYAKSKRENLTAAQTAWLYERSKELKGGR